MSNQGSMIMRMTDEQQERAQAHKDLAKEVADFLMERHDLFDKLGISMMFAMSHIKDLDPTKEEDAELIALGAQSHVGIVAISNIDGSDEMRKRASEEYGTDAGHALCELARRLSLLFKVVESGGVSIPHQELAKVLLSSFKKLYLMQD